MKEKDELREHSFDGIQEYDNALPRWWLWLFAVTVVGSVIYPFVYDFGPGQFDSETIDDEMAVLAKQRTEVAESAGAADDGDALIKLVSSSAAVQEGQQIFASKCMACHGDKGQGIVGPNLVDDYWLHGGKITDVRNVIVNGVLDKGMLAWKDLLTPDQINAVVVYIWSLHGTNPPNPKAPQGDLVPRT